MARMRDVLVNVKVVPTYSESFRTAVEGVIRPCTEHEGCCVTVEYVPPDLRGTAEAKAEECYAMGVQRAEEQLELLGLGQDELAEQLSAEAQWLEGMGDLLYALAGEIA